MNQTKKLLLLLAIISFGLARVQARISNVAYQLRADQTNAGKPMVDPTLGTAGLTTDVVDSSSFTLSFLDTNNNQMVLAETASTSNLDKSLMLAQINGGVIKLSSLALPTPTVALQANGLVGLSAQTTLQNKHFDVIAGGNNTTLLRDANISSRLFIVDDSTGNFTEVAAQDGNLALGNIDDFIVVGNRVVSGVFENGATTFYEQPYGRIRVLNLISGGQIGVAKRDTSLTPYSEPGGTYTELQIHAGTSNPVPTADLNALISGSHSEVTKIGSMVWDPSLQRLFIAFTRVESAFSDVNRMPFLVGRFDNDDLLLEPLAPLGATGNTTSAIVSFNADSGIGTQSAPYSIPFVKTLHVKATTVAGITVDHPYLVTQINYDTTSPTSNVNKRVFAVPLVGNSAAAAFDLGKVADIANLDIATPAAAISNLFPQDPTSTNSDVRALVGGAPVPVDTFTDIKGIDVIGQTVLVATIAGVTSAAAQMGIWASTAIIDAAGAIVGWAPWTRVSGIHEQVYRMGVAGNGQIWTVHGNTKTGTPGSISSVSLPTFGDGMRAPRDSENSLGSAAKSWDFYGLGSIGYKAVQALAGKIFTARHFQANATSGLNGNSLVAFGGEGKVVLARTGAASSVTELSKGTPFSTYAFETDAVDEANFANYQLFEATNHPALAALGNIYALELSRSREASQGWLFAGGQNGLVVFSNSSGAGFSPASLSNLQIAFVSGSIQARSIAQITEPVIGLAAVSQQIDTSNSLDSNAYLVVLTKSRLLRIPLAAGNFDASSTGASAVVPQEISLGLASDERCLFLEMLSHHSNSANATSGAAGVVVTTKGIYVLNNLQGTTVTVQKQGITFTDDISSSIRRVQILPRAPYSGTAVIGQTTSEFNPGKVIANLLLVTGTATNPASAIFVVPLVGQQFTSFTQSNACQGSFSLDTTAALTPIRLASEFDLGQSTVFAASTLGLPLVAYSRQSVNGNILNAHVDLLGGATLSNLTSSSVSSLSTNSGGNGGTMLTDRGGKIIVQE